MYRYRVQLYTSGLSLALQVPVRVWEVLNCGKSWHLTRYNFSIVLFTGTVLMFHISVCADLLQRIRRKVLFIWVSGTILLLRIQNRRLGENWHLFSDVIIEVARYVLEAATCRPIRMLPMLPTAIISEKYCPEIDWFPHLWPHPENENVISFPFGVQFCAGTIFTFELTAKQVFIFWRCRWSSWTFGKTNFTHLF